MHNKCKIREIKCSFSTFYDVKCFIQNSDNDCREQEKALGFVTEIADIAIMVEKNENPAVDDANKEDLNEMFRSIVAARYGISGKQTSWDLHSLNEIAKTTKMASKWVPDWEAEKSNFVVYTR